MYNNLSLSQHKSTNIKELIQGIVQNVSPKGTVNIDTSLVNSYKPKYKPLDQEGFYAYLKGGNKERGHNCPMRQAAVNFVINQLRHFNNKFIDTIPNMAKNIGCSPDYLQEVLAELKRLGVIYSKRQTNAPKVYSLNPELTQEVIKERFHPFLVATRTLMRLAMLLSVIPTSNFCNSLKPSKDKTHIILRDEERTISLSSNHSQVQEAKVVNEIHFTETTKLLDIYPYLSSRIAVAVAIKSSLTPFKGAWLAQVPNEILCRAYELYFYATKYKKPVSNIATFLCGNIIAMCKEKGIVINYRLVSATVSMYGLDTNWTTMSIQEKSQLAGKIKPIGELYAIQMQKLWNSQNKEQELNEKKFIKPRPYCAFNTYDNEEEKEERESFTLRNSSKISQPKQGTSSLSNPPSSANSPHVLPKETQLLNNSAALGPAASSMDLFKHDLNNYRTSLSNLPLFMRDMMEVNFSNILRDKYPFLPSDFCMLKFDL